MDIRNITIKCKAEKLVELLDLLNVDYVEKIIISRTQEEFTHDEFKLDGLLDEFELDELLDDSFKLDNLLDDSFEDDGLLEEDDDFEWDN